MKKADLLSKVASSNLVEILEKPSIKWLIVVPVDIVEDLRTPFIDYLLSGELSLDRNEVVSLIKRAIKYCLVDEVLYK
jgi:hypothetical protein